MNKTFIQSLIIFGIFFLQGCAGPTNPFGSRVGFDLNKPSKDFDPQNFYLGQKSKKEVKIDFSPKAQNWHQSKVLKINIETTFEISPNYSFRLYYNQKEITDDALWISNTKLSHDKKKMSIIFPKLRFLPGRDNHLMVYFRPDPFTPYTAAEYASPTCRLANEEGDVLNLPKEGKHLKDIILNVARKKEVSNGMLGGLIAQESWFNPRAVSSSKALGLTQVTDLASEHVIKDYPFWPKYGGVENFDAQDLRLFVMMGVINKKNDWRLDETKSIEGGAHYIGFLKKYWNGEEEKELMRKAGMPLMEDLILASYHSGAYRVKKNLQDFQKDWLLQRDLKEARKYIGKVKSYCNQFSEIEERYEN